MSEDAPECPFAEPVEIPIEDSLDLHGFHPRETAEVVDAYLEAALERGFCEVRLIHGRGMGARRRQVRALLERDARVREFFDAPPQSGGWGATVCRLRSGESP